MGDAKRKKARFLAQHPKCCFCGGDVDATTVDHVPPRMFFKERHGPETFEFPACDHCQTASRKDELAMGFYVHLLDRNDNNLDERQIDKLITGMANNMPHLLPNPHLSGRKKRAKLREMGYSTPNLFSSQLPVVDINPELHDVIYRYTRKMACAIFYREVGHIASSNHLAMANWGSVADMNFVAMARQMLTILPSIEVGRRSNVDIGDQFRYASNSRADPDVLAALVTFGQGMAVQILMAEPDFVAKLDSFPGFNPWVRVADNYPKR